MLQLPSLYHAATQAGRVARRFPLTLLCAGALCGAGCYFVHYSSQEATAAGWVFPLLSASALGLTLTLALTLAAERYRWGAPTYAAAQVGALALLAGWYALAPARPDLAWGTRLALLLLGLHLAVAAAPYLAELRRGADTPGFWRYNQLLFGWLLTTGLYSGVLYAGGALALVALRELFGLPLSSNAFGYLFVGLAAVFNTWFFLAGVPADFDALEEDAPYPTGLKIFTQFVLLPLVVLYLAILYAYLGRILGRWALPQGWVSGLILALAVAGILALLLIHPLRQRPENTWIRTFGRWFYWALFPLLGLLAVAIGTRVRAYGFTEERYFVLLLAAWLLGLASYFLWRRGRGIIWIPATLAGLALGAAAGPWGAFAVAERSQLAQLRALTERYHLLHDGHLDGAITRATRLPRPVRGRLASVFNFFVRRDALARLQPQFAGSLQLPDSLRRQEAYAQRQWLDDRLFELSGLARFEPYELEDNPAGGPRRVTTNYYVRDPTAYHALGQGLYWLKDIGTTSGPDHANGVVLELPAREGTFRLLTASVGDSLLVQQRAAGGWHTQLRLSLRAPADSLLQRDDQGGSVAMPRPLELRAANAHLRLRLFVSSLYREQTGQRVQYSYSAEGLLQITP